jgi:hypothetical protein
MDDDEVLSPDGLGRINLPGPTPDELEAAAQDVLGDRADEALFPDGSKLFRGAAAPGAVFIQGPEEQCGTNVAAASCELQDQLMAEARKVREARVEAERADYIDPDKNELIKFPED